MNLSFTSGQMRRGVSTATKVQATAACASASGIPRRKRARSQGIALVITLILLAVITFMAIAFLVLSRGQKSSVTMQTDQMQARLGADAALERAKAELVAPIIGLTNEFQYDMLVSTNFNNPAGFVTGNTAVTNVSYTYPNGLPVRGDDALQNLANLYYNPRPPVYITTRTATNTFEDFRYYLDLNRNFRYDTNGLVIALGPTGLPLMDSNNLPIRVFVTGDPEWIGITEFCDRRHSPTNRFTSRYAYLVVPASKTLDLNFIHNYARLLTPASMTSGDGFLRNQGVGTWEINLAAFLVDLNTNLWPFPAVNALGYRPYLYDLTDYNNLPNQGVAFEDAWNITRFRYGYGWTNLFSVQNKFGVRGMNAFRLDFFDGYTRGPLMTNTWWPVANVDADSVRTTQPWTGSDNTNHFFTTQDLFDPNKTSLGFSNRMWLAGTATDTYNRYTFYRLQSGLGTDSAPEPPKVNLNYANIDRDGVVVPSLTANFTPWTPARFFTNAVDRLLRAQGFAFGVNKIPVYTNGGFVYTPSIHRLLQLAANIYDATTNNTVPGVITNFPTIFRPQFEVVGNDLYITNFVPVNDSVQQLFTKYQLKDLADTNVIRSINPDDLVMGVPLVVGAKKGLPNFNETAFQSVYQITRKLQITRKSPTEPRSSWHTNTMYVLSVTNSFGVEAWNSYQAAYTRPIDIYATNFVTVALTNDAGVRLTGNYLIGTNMYIGPGGVMPTWPGMGAANNPNLNSVVVPTRSNLPFLRESVYRFGSASFTTNLNVPFEYVEGYPNPHWGLGVTNRLLFVIVDRQSQRILDYVHLTALNGIRDLSRDAADPDRSLGINGMWATNRVGGTTISHPPQGLINQITFCLDPANDTADWTSYGAYNKANGATKTKEISEFRSFWNRDTGNTNLAVQVPFSPTRRVSQYLSWQANDPLVHYSVGDLTLLGGGTGILQENLKRPRAVMQNIGKINDRYSPWGGNPVKTGGTDETADPQSFNLAVKDPGVTRSDAWNFPTNKFANVGWLGRVHRGTPWQTVYLKSTDVAATAEGLKAWKRWSGNPDDVDAARTSPVNDRRLLQVFTAAIDENSTRGQLSINQTNLAAWSAVFGGVLALQADPNATQFTPPTNNWTVIQPAGSDGPRAPVWQIVDAINDVRRTNYNGTFRHLGDVLAVPELTEKSPYLNLAQLGEDAKRWGISDDVYERLPQQVLGLVKIDPVPRFVIYSWGQSLKPADRSIITSGRFFGMCTNYQITAEVATRAVVRIEGAPDRPRAVVESFNLLPPD